MTFTPTGVRIPVESMSTRALIGMVKAFVQPGSCTASFISAVSSPGVMRRRSGQIGLSARARRSGAQEEYQRGRGSIRQSSTGLRRTVVSTMVSGAGSVADSARPALPNTLATSGSPRRIRSWICTCRFASSIDRLGKVVGM